MLVLRWNMPLVTKELYRVDQKFWYEQAYRDIQLANQLGTKGERPSANQVLHWWIWSGAMRQWRSSTG